MFSPLVLLAAVMVLGVAAQWLAWRFRLPAILLLLAFGFAAGQVADPDEYVGTRLLFPFVSLSVAIILFEGGLSLRFRELKETSRVVLRLVTIGAVTTWLLATVAARCLVFDDPRVAALAGAILVVTGPTVIGPLLRHVRPVRRIGAIARWEGIVIDPVGALLAVLVFEATLAGGPEAAALAVVFSLAKTIVVGVVLGLLSARLLVELLDRHWVPDYLHNPVVLATVLGVFAASHRIQPESGLATVTILGIALANQKRVSIAHLLEFKETLGILLISVLFIVLSSRIHVSDLQNLGWQSLAFLAVLLFVVRPAATLLATLGTPLSVGERIFLGWLAPRGIVAAAVASVFSLELARHAEGGVAFSEDLSRLVPLVFFVIVGTVAVYGLTAAALARRLGLADPNPQGILFAGADPFAVAIAEVIVKLGFRVLMVDTNERQVAAARMAGLPTCNASVLSEYVREDVDLGGIGRLLAVTHNDEVNTLAALEFLDQFGRSNVYQLKPDRGDSSKRQARVPHLRGRFLFAEGTTHDLLTSRFVEGHTVKATGLTQEFDYAAFRERNGDAALLLFVVDPSGRLDVCTAGAEPAPKPGQTVVYLVGPVPADERESRHELRASRHV